MNRQKNIDCSSMLEMNARVTVNLGDRKFKGKIVGFTKGLTGLFYKVAIDGAKGAPFYVYDATIVKPIVSNI